MKNEIIIQIKEILNSHRANRTKIITRMNRFLFADIFLQFDQVRYDYQISKHLPHLV